MLPQEKIDEVKQLLEAGRYSERAVSRLTGVSRSVIKRIATGERREKIQRPPEIWEEDRSGRPFRRCSICGGLVQLPCLACALRDRKRTPGFPDDPISSDLVLGLNLKEEHRIRYEIVKARVHDEE